MLQRHYRLYRQPELAFIDGATSNIQTQLDNVKPADSDQTIIASQIFG